MQKKKLLISIKISIIPWKQKYFDLANAYGINLIKNNFLTFQLTQKDESLSMAERSRIFYLLIVLTGTLSGRRNLFRYVLHHSLVPVTKK